MRALHFVPTPPHTLNGITHYAQALSDSWFAKYGVSSSFINPSNDDTIKRLGVLKHDGKDYKYTYCEVSYKVGKSSFLSIVKEYDVFIVHFGFYLTPFLGVIKASKEASGMKLVTMFHEIVPSRKSLGRNLIDRLKVILPARDPGPFRGRSGFAHISDIALTNTLKFQQILSTYIGDSVRCLPCFSNVGEPTDVPSILEREKRMVVFGSGGTRSRIYRNRLESLLVSCQALGIKEIWDIGGGEGLVMPNLSNSDISIVQLGPKPAKDVSNIFLHSTAGFFDYSHYANGMLGKSGVIAAYSAHGMVPVSPVCHSPDVDNFEAGKHYFVPGQGYSTSEEKLQMIADSAYSWYQKHSLQQTSETYAELLGFN